VITSVDRITLSHKSSCVSVNIDVEPNNTVQTSAARFVVCGKRFIIKYPTPNAPAEISATDASPLIFEFLPVRNSRIAHIIVAGKTKNVLSVNRIAAAIVAAPNATCDNPEPMNDSLLSTSVTPKRDEHIAISTPTMTA